MVLHSVTLSNMIPALCTTREGSSQHSQQCFNRFRGRGVTLHWCTVMPSSRTPRLNASLNTIQQTASSCLHSVVYLEKSQFGRNNPASWWKVSAQKRLVCCCLSSAATPFPVLPCNTHFVSSSFPKCSPATFTCIPPEGGPFQAKQAAHDEISGSTVHSAYLCPCDCKN